MMTVYSGAAVRDYAQTATSAITYPNPLLLMALAIVAFLL